MSILENWHKVSTIGYLLEHSFKTNCLCCNSVSQLAIQQSVSQSANQFFCQAIYLLNIQAISMSYHW